MASPIIVSLDVQLGSNVVPGHGQSDVALTPGQVVRISGTTGNLVLGDIDTAENADLTDGGITLGTCGANGFMTFVKSGGIWYHDSAIFTKGAYYWLGAGGTIDDAKPAATKYLTGLGLAISTKELAVEISIKGVAI